MSAKVEKLNQIAKSHHAIHRFRAGLSQGKENEKQGESMKTKEET